MGSSVFSLRASVEERAAWELAAEAEELSFNAWARRALNEQRDLEASLARLEELDERRAGDPV